jgi:hypothetical protein
MIATRRLCGKFLDDFFLTAYIDSPRSLVQDMTLLTAKKSLRVSRSVSAFSIDRIRQTVILSPPNSDVESGFAR